MKRRALAVQPDQSSLSRRPVRRPPFGAGVRLVAAVVGIVAACAALAAPPLDRDPDRDLRRAVREAAERELAEARLRPEPVRLTRESRLATLGIPPEVLEELERVAGPASYAGARLELGPDLLGAQQQTSLITLEHAVQTAVQHNLNVEFARLAPVISQQQLIAAEAAFDWVLFNNTTWSNTDQPRPGTSLNNIRVGTQIDQRNVFDTAIGIRKGLISGGQVTIQHQFIYTDNQTPGLLADPDPSRESNLVMQIDQPLLRNFGSDVALGQVRLAQNAERDEIQSLKAALLENVTQVEQAYWDLVRARDDLLILQRLAARGAEVLEILRRRRDAQPVNIATAAAEVESRRADILQAERVLRGASDTLKGLMNDPRLPVGGEVLLLPVDTPLDQPVEFSLVDSINTSFANRPEVQRAIISIDNTAIRERVADNARLPQLNLRALTRFSGLGGSTHGAYDSLVERQFIDYQIGIQFELPIGNRAAEANFRAARTQRMQANIAYVNTLQRITEEVKSTLRDVVTSFQLIEQTRLFRIAAAEDVHQLAIMEATTSGLTPDFLDIKLRRQRSLAAAEQREVQALTDYASALARFHAACGTALERNRILFEIENVRPQSGLSDLFPDYPAEPLWRWRR